MIAGVHCVNIITGVSGIFSMMPVCRDHSYDFYIKTINNFIPALGQLKGWEIQRVPVSEHPRQLGEEFTSKTADQWSKPAIRTQQAAECARRQLAWPDATLILSNNF